MAGLVLGLWLGFRVRLGSSFRVTVSHYVGVKQPPPQVFIISCTPGTKSVVCYLQLPCLKQQSTYTNVILLKTRHTHVRDTNYTQTVVCRAYDTQKGTEMPSLRLCDFQRTCDILDAEKE